MRTLVIIPAYNEQENIVDVIRDIKEHAPDVDYIVINDCSTDDTNSVLICNSINYIELPVNLGIGGGVQTGYRYALENGYDIAVQFDGDGQHSAEFIRTLTDPIKSGEADVVIGSRFINNEGFQSSWQRRLGINFLSRLIKILCGAEIKDVTSGLRAVNRKMIKEFANDYAQDYPEPEALMQSVMCKASIIEVPVNMKERAGGKSSIVLWKPIYYMVKVSLAMILQRITLERRKQAK